MAKGSILSDTFEQLAELGVSTAQKTVKSVAQIVNPFDKAKTSEVNAEQNLARTSEVKRGKDHTPLDFKKLQEKFKDKEKMKMEGLRNKLFQIVRREDEKVLERKHMDEAQKKRQEEYEIQDKKRKEDEKRKQDGQGNIPMGKKRQSIFSKKKTTDQQHAELKPASGKQ